MSLSRPTNRPRDVIVQMAQEAIREHGGPDYARAFYKYDCADCGSREQIAEPNTLPIDAVCSKCSSITAIVAAGYALQIRRETSIDWDNPNTATLRIRPAYTPDVDA